VAFDEFEAYIERPENADRLLELINGEIIEKVPTEEHGTIVLRIAAPMLYFVDAHKLGRVTTEGLHRLPDDPLNAVLPDLSFRCNPGSPVVRKGAVPVMPDLAVEVQSPSQSDQFMADKAAYYLAHGCRMVWLAFAAKRTVAVHRPGQIDTFGMDDTLDGGDVLPGFKLRVSDIFKED
jgi:Uma2 family endonuclease